MTVKLQAEHKNFIFKNKSIKKNTVQMKSQSKVIPDI